MSSLLSYGFQGNAGLTKPLRPKAHAAIPQLFDPLTGSLSSRLHCTKAQHAYLRDRHLVSYADVIAWTGTGWRWQFPDLPLPLLDALRGLSLPVSESVPLLPGQAWHLTDPSQLFSNRITEILTVSTYSTPTGFRSDIVYRHWTLPLSVLSPTVRTVARRPSTILLYHGPSDIDSWFPEIFGTSSMSGLRASRITLVSSNGTPHRSGLPPPLSTMDSLPSVVEVLRVLPFLPPGHLGRVPVTGPPLGLTGPYYDPAHVGKRTVYVQLHYHSGFSPIHSVLGVGTFRISLCVLRTLDHVQWSPTLYQGEVPANTTRPTSQSLLLAGVLRGLWESDPEADLRDLDIYLPDQSLVKSFRSPPASFSNEVVECLFEAAHIHVTPSRRLCYAATPSDLSTRSLSGPALEMALASAYAISGLSQTELCSSIYGTLFQEDPVQVLPLSECIPPRTSFSTDGSGPTSPRSPFFSSP